MIEFRCVTKRYGHVLAVDNASFTVPDGKIVGLLGRNGAGKTTLMRMLTGALPPTSGAIRINGHDVIDEPGVTRRMIGYLPERPPLYEDMRVDEYLRFVASLKRVPTASIRDDIARACASAGLSYPDARLIRHLSKGYRQRVGLAQALIGAPAILVLDEPTAGLDPLQILETRRAIKRLGGAHTVLVSSHILSEIADTCDSVAIIHHGKIVAENTLAALTNGANATARLRLRVRGAQDAVLAILHQLPLKHIECLGEKETGAYDYRIDAERELDARALIFHALAQAQYTILAMQSIDVGLEDIFIQLTGDPGEV